MSCISGPHKVANAAIVGRSPKCFCLYPLLITKNNSGFVSYKHLVWLENEKYFVTPCQCILTWESKCFLSQIYRTFKVLVSMRSGKALSLLVLGLHQIPCWLTNTNNYFGAVLNMRDLETKLRLELSVDRKQAQVSQTIGLVKYPQFG